MSWRIGEPQAAQIIHTAADPNSQSIAVGMMGPLKTAAATSSAASATLTPTAAVCIQVVPSGSANVAPVAKLRSDQATAMTTSVSQNQRWRNPNSAACFQSVGL